MSARVLVAGVGNVFLSDDGFGVEVARRLAERALPEGVVVRDVGVRGLHLAYDLLDAPELLIVVDLAPRGGAPGTLYVLEPELAAEGPRPSLAHGTDLAGTFATLEALGGSVPRVLIVGCEPADLREAMGLSAPVHAAVDAAIALVLRLAGDVIEGRAIVAAHTEEETCCT